MPDADTKFAMLDEAEIAAATLRRDPYDYAFAEQAIFPQFKEEVLADAPKIPDRGSYGLPNLNYGPAFGTVVRELLSPRFKRLMEQKFDVDLSSNPAVVLMMGNTTGHYNEGYAHPNSKHKIITVIVGFSREWPYERGRLRVLRSSDRNDSAFEFPPEYGRMLMFRVCDHSWHGFLPQKGPRMSLQLCFVDSEAYVRSEYLAPRRQRLRQIGADDPQGDRLGAASHLTRQESEDRMNFPNLPGVDEVALHVGGALGAARRDDEPFRHWLLADVLPYEMCVGVLTLPIAPPVIDDCRGVRDRHNDKRCFFNPRLQSRFPACALLAEAMQRPALARRFQDVCDVAVEGGYLRMEYIQDTDGAWLEPHRDIKEKLFSMVIYLCTGPEAENWGTDIYDDQRRWVGRSSAQFNSAVIFVAGPDTWHGFDKRPIDGVRRLMEINYVAPSWRDRDQLSFPDRPIVVAR